MTDRHSSNRCPTLSDLPLPPPGKIGWPWTEGSQPLPETMPDGSPWPRVSVVTPSYNQGQFLEETIRSVLLQGYPNLEYLIVDGGSADDSVEIIRKYEPWLAYWVSERDNGQAHAINKGWQKATGAYVTWLNSDDLLWPSSLDRTVRALEGDKQAVIAYGDVWLIDAQSQRFPKPYDQIPARPFSLEGMMLFWRNPVPQQGFLMRRALLDQVGYLDESYHFTMDFEYWARIALAGGPGIPLSCPVAAFRHHQLSKTDTIQLRRIADRYKIHEKVFAGSVPAILTGKADESLSNLHLSAAYIAYSAGEAVAMRRYASRHIAQRGLRASPQAWVYWLLSLTGRRGILALRQMWQSRRQMAARSHAS